MKSTPKLPAEGDCCGCGLCESVCSKGAITMQEDSYGFIKPEVDSAVCVGCKACEIQCTRYHQYAPHTELSDCYEAWNTDHAERQDSSSGGVWTALARWCLERNGVVIGVVWTARDQASYIVAESEHELKGMRRSKYIQADTSGIIREIHVHLSKGRHVLYTGLPCHARAVRMRFGYNNDKLLILDIACYGVPSRNLLRAFFRSKEKEGAVVSRYDCREKDQGWRSYCACIHYISGAKEVLHCTRNMFQSFFVMSGLGYNLSCYRCELHAFGRYSDISMGDYWGRLIHDDGDREGVSSVICLTNKGKTVLEMLAQRNRLHVSPIRLDDLLRGNGGFAKSPRAPHPLREKFLQLIKTEALDDIRRYTVDYYYNPLPCMRIAGKLVCLPRLIASTPGFCKKAAGRFMRFLSRTFGCLFH